MRIAVITGASRKLGLAVAQEFATHGWQVFGTGRSQPPASLPANVTYRQFDASDAKACELFWRQLAEQYPDTEMCLVNNAGSYVSGRITEVKAEDYISQMRSCYFSSVHMTRSLTLTIPKAKIINIISTSALDAHEEDSAYGAAKAAQRHFFQCLQQEFSPQQYQIINLYPADIAPRDANPKAIDPEDLAAFVRQQAENTRTYYLRDVTIYPA